MSESMAYIARRPCGCFCAALVDNSDHAKDTAKEVAKLIRDGYAVERVTVEAVRTGPWSCAKCRKPRATSTFDLTASEKSEARP